MTRTLTRSSSRTYVSVEVIKIPQRHPNLQKSPDIQTISKAKLSLALEKIRTPKSFRKLKHYGPFGNDLQHKNRIIYKPVLRLSK